MLPYYGRQGPSPVTLDNYVCDLNLEISNDGYSCYPMSKGGFAYMWAGAKANYGISQGQVCYEVRITDFNDVSNEVTPSDGDATYVVRVGWSADAATLQLGEDLWSFGYGGTGKISYNRKFTDYGMKFGRGDVVQCYLTLQSGWLTLAYKINENYLGDAFKMRWSSDEPLYPHILTKNCKLEVNFGQNQFPYYPIEPDYKLIAHTSLEGLVPALKCPLSQRDCEVVMLVGLPGVGKTTWATDYAKKNHRKKYFVLGTDSIIEKMRVEGLPRKKNFNGRWEVLIKQSTECFNTLLKKAANLPRNLILDQTNVYSSARKRKVAQYREKGFMVNCMVIVPPDKEMIRRSILRTQEQGKDVPESAVLDMKANFTLPQENEGLFDQITFLELQRPAAENLVAQYNREACQKGHKSNTVRPAQALSALNQTYGAVPHNQYDQRQQQPPRYENDGDSYYSQQQQTNKSAYGNNNYQTPQTHQQQRSEGMQQQSGYYGDSSNGDSQRYSYNASSYRPQQSQQHIDQHPKPYSQDTSHSQQRPSIDSAMRNTTEAQPRYGESNPSARDRRFEDYNQSPRYPPQNDRNRSEAGFVDQRNLRDDFNDFEGNKNYQHQHPRNNAGTYQQQQPGNNMRDDWNRGEGNSSLPPRDVANNQQQPSLNIHQAKSDYRGESARDSNPPYSNNTPRGMQRPREFGDSSGPPPPSSSSRDGPAPNDYGYDARDPYPPSRQPPNQHRDQPLSSQQRPPYSNYPQQDTQRYGENRDYPDRGPQQQYRGNAPLPQHQQDFPPSHHQRPLHYQQQQQHSGHPASYDQPIKKESELERFGNPAPAGSGPPSNYDGMPPERRRNEYEVEDHRQRPQRVESGRGPMTMMRNEQQQRPPNLQPGDRFPPHDQQQYSSHHRQPPHQEEPPPPSGGGFPRDGDGGGGEFMNNRGLGGFGRGDGHHFNPKPIHYGGESGEALPLPRGSTFGDGGMPPNNDDVFAHRQPGPVGSNNFNDQPMIRNDNNNSGGGGVYRPSYPKPQRDAPNNDNFPMMGQQQIHHDHPPLRAPRPHHQDLPPHQRPLQPSGAPPQDNWRGGGMAIERTPPPRNHSDYLAHDDDDGRARRSLGVRGGSRDRAVRRNYRSRSNSPLRSSRGRRRSPDSSSYRSRRDRSSSRSRREKSSRRRSRSRERRRDDKKSSSSGKNDSKSSEKKSSSEKEKTEMTKTVSSSAEAKTGDAVTAATETTAATSAPSKANAKSDSDTKIEVGQSETPPAKASLDNSKAAVDKKDESQESKSESRKSSSDKSSSRDQSKKSSTRSDKSDREKSDSKRSESKSSSRYDRSSRGDKRSPERMSKGGGRNDRRSSPPRRSRNDYSSSRGRMSSTTRGGSVSQPSRYDESHRSPPRMRNQPQDISPQHGNDQLRPRGPRPSIPNQQAHPHSLQPRLNRPILNRPPVRMEHMAPDGRSLMGPIPRRPPADFFEQGNFYDEAYAERLLSEEQAMIYQEEQMYNEQVYHDDAMAYCEDGNPDHHFPFDEEMHWEGGVEPHVPPMAPRPMGVMRPRMPMMRPRLMRPPRPMLRPQGGLMGVRPMAPGHRPMMRPRGPLLRPPMHH